MTTWKYVFKIAPLQIYKLYAIYFLLSYKYKNDDDVFIAIMILINLIRDDK